MKILLAEDDPHVRRGLTKILVREGYEVIEAINGKQALQIFHHEKPDFMLLDIMMPERNGYDICAEIRQYNMNIPVIFISAKSEEIDRVLGLELGADDYITKPFSISEVLARIRAVTRRCYQQNHILPEECFIVGDLTVYPNALYAMRFDNQPIELNLRDIKILQLLHKNKGKIVSKEILSQECWGRAHLPSSRALDQYIAKLRKQIEKDPSNPEIIGTVYGVGYRYDG